MSLSKHGSSKLEEICHKLRQDALEPAEQEASSIIENARKEAERIICQAKDKVREIEEKSQDQVKEHLKAGEEALKLSAQRVIAALKYDIENALFGSSLKQWLDKELSNEQSVVSLIEAVVTILKRDGLDTDIVVKLGSELPMEKIHQLLGSLVVESFKEKRMIKGNFSSGVRLQVANNKFNVEIDRESLEEVFKRYLQKSFREILFG